MSVATRHKAPWHTHEYQRILSAIVEDRVLVVAFEDGSTARLDLSTLPELEPKDPVWAKLAFDTYDITVPSRDGDIEISSFNIRALTDPAFDRYLAERAAASARRHGERIRELRRAQRLGEEELAARAGIAPERLRRIERGADGISLPTLERIVAAMGHDLGVFVVRDHEEDAQTEVDTTPPSAG